MRCESLSCPTLKLHDCLAHSGGRKQLTLPRATFQDLPERSAHVHTISECEATANFLGSVLPMASACSPLTSTDLVSQPRQPLSTLLPGPRKHFLHDFLMVWW